jgi:hypothetical protein
MRLVEDPRPAGSKALRGGTSKSLIRRRSYSTNQMTNCNFLQLRRGGGIHLPQREKL